MSANEIHQSSPSFSDLHELTNTAAATELKHLIHHLIDSMDELQQQHINLRNEFERLRESSVPLVSEAMRNAGRFLRKGKHKTRPHEWVVINDPQYVVFCDDRSAAIGLGFTSDEISVARRSMRDAPSLKDRRWMVALETSADGDAGAAS